MAETEMELSFASVCGSERAVSNRTRFNLFLQKLIYRPHDRSVSPSIFTRLLPRTLNSSNLLLLLPMSTIITPLFPLSIQLISTTKLFSKKSSNLETCSMWRGMIWMNEWPVECGNATGRIHEMLLSRFSILVCRFGMRALLSAV